MAVRALLGYLPQEFGAWRLHRVEEVLDTLALLSGLKDKTARRGRVRAVLEQVGLNDVADRKVKKLSGGMVRRLGVAQALVHDPRLIVVDEPTVGLDPQERLRFRQLMADLGHDRTIVLSTHIVADLGSSCSDMALIDGGKIVFRGDPSELMQRARGRVFEIVIPAGGDQTIAADYEVVSRVREGESMRVRAVSAGERLPEGAAPVASPTLEEAYLAFMAALGRVEAAIVESAEEQEQ
jgi:ABC-type multidrug transport system ATPase subunit